MEKVVIFDWGGVIMHKYPVENNDKEAIIRTIKSFNEELSDDEAWDVYIKTLKDENGIYISRQNDGVNRRKWFERINEQGNLDTDEVSFVSKFVEEHLKVGYYKELVDYIHSLKGKCKLCIFSDLIYCCQPALDRQVNLSEFDHVWLSFNTHLRKNTIEAFELVEQDLNVSPENILFVDDTAVNIENASNRGWNTCQAFGYELDKIKSSVESFLSNEKEDSHMK